MRMQGRPNRGPVIALLAIAAVIVVAAAFYLLYLAPR